jgi:hypothetical protein
MNAHRINNRSSNRLPESMVESDPPESPIGTGGFNPPSPEETWQHTQRWYCRGSVHEIVGAPFHAEFLRREVVVVECPRRNLKTVLIEVDGRRMRWPIVWLRPIITESIRKVLAEDSARLCPVKSAGFIERLQLAQSYLKKREAEKEGE